MSYEDLIKFIKENLRIEIQQEGHSFTVQLRFCGEVISEDYYGAYWTMSRSRKKHSAAKICGRSNKRSKQMANRKFRHKEQLSLLMEKYERIPEHIREVSDVYNFSSDGLAYWMDMPIEDYFTRYWNLEAWKKMMRKWDHTVGANESGSLTRRTATRRKDT